MKKNIILLLVFCSLKPSVYCQNIDKLIYSPIVGFTSMPYENNFYASLDLGFYFSNSFYDHTSDQVILKYQIASVGDPEIAIWTGKLGFIYSITKSLGLQFDLPFIFNQQFDLNLKTGYKARTTTYWGKNGIGDMTIAGLYLLYDDQNHRILTRFNYQLATGSSPDELDETNFGSTGSGHTSYSIGLISDNYINRITLISIGGHYIVNNKAQYNFEDISINQKDGDAINLISQLKFLLSPRLSFGILVSYLKSKEVKIEGHKISGSDSRSLQFFPLLGYRLGNKTNSLFFNIGYSTYVSGKNVFSFKGLKFKLHKFFI
jgi:hypothetical protein